MTSPDSVVLHEVLRKLAVIETKQDGITDDIAEIKTDLKEIRKADSEQDDKIKKLELCQAECKGQRKTLAGMSAAVGGAVSAAAMIIAEWLINLR